MTEKPPFKAPTPRVPDSDTIGALVAFAARNRCLCSYGTKIYDGTCLPCWALREHVRNYEALDRELRRCGHPSGHTERRLTELRAELARRLDA